MMHIKSLKYLTKNSPIHAMPVSSVLYLPLTGDARPLVNVGEEVKMYQLIGVAEEDHPRGRVHSPVSGIIKDIRDSFLVGGRETKIIEIENNFKEEREKDFLKSDYHHFTKDELLRRIHDAGVLGAGGAEFPAAIKYELKGKKVTTFIINGAECEPYLTADYAVMSQWTEAFFEGIEVVNTLLEPDEIVIAVEEHSRNLSDYFASYFRLSKYKNVRFQTVPNDYPQGGELQLIRSVTGKEISRGTIPIEIGVILNNVGTIYAVGRAVIEGIPMIDRVLTISGERVHKGGNYLVRIGTPVRDLLAQVGYEEKNTEIIMGGPMMGKPVTDFSIPVTKGTNGLLVLSKESFERLPCIGCGYCVDVCPMRLMPLKYAEFYFSENYNEMKVYDLDDCIECASCECICPSNVPLMESIFKGKEYLEKEQENE